MAMIGFGDPPVNALVKWTPLGDVLAVHRWPEDPSGVPVEVLGVRGHVFVDKKKFRSLADGLKECRTVDQTWLELVFAPGKDLPAGTLHIRPVDATGLASLGGKIDDLWVKMPRYRFCSKQKPPWARSVQTEEPHPRLEGAGGPATTSKGKALAKVKAAVVKKTGRARQTTEALMGMRIFRTLVSSILAMQGKEGMKFEEKALRTLMSAAEDHVARVFEKAAKAKDDRSLMDTRRKEGKSRKPTQEGTLLVQDMKAACRTASGCLSPGAVGPDAKKTRTDAKKETAAPPREEEAPGTKRATRQKLAEAKTQNDKKAAQKEEKKVEVAMKETKAASSKKPQPKPPPKSANKAKHAQKVKKKVQGGEEGDEYGLLRAAGQSASQVDQSQSSGCQKRSKITRRARPWHLDCLTSESSLVI